MTNFHTPCWPLIAISVLAICTGCPKSGTNSKPVPSTLKSEPTADANPDQTEILATQQDSQPQRNDRQTPAVVAPETPAAAVAKPPTPDVAQVEAEAYEPRIVLSNTHESTCLLKVGDTLPQLTLTDIEGTQLQLQSRFGENVTLIVFWTSGSVAGLEQFERLTSEIWSPWAGAGVDIIAVNVGDDLEIVRELTGEASDKIASLWDEGGSIFAQFATSILPRTYLVDSQGKILWFDIEYSRSTRRELRNALTYYLKAGT